MELAFTCFLFGNGHWRLRAIYIRSTSIDERMDLFRVKVNRSSTSKRNLITHDMSRDVICKGSVFDIILVSFRGESRRLCRRTEIIRNHSDSKRMEYHSLDPVDRWPGLCVALQIARDLRVSVHQLRFTRSRAATFPTLRRRRSIDYSRNWWDQSAGSHWRPAVCRQSAACWTGRPVAAGRASSPGLVPQCRHRKRSAQGRDYSSAASRGMCSLKVVQTLLALCSPVLLDTVTSHRETSRLSASCYFNEILWVLARVGSSGIARIATGILDTTRDLIFTCRSNTVSKGNSSSDVVHCSSRRSRDRESISIDLAESPVDLIVIPVSGDCAGCVAFAGLT